MNDKELKVSEQTRCYINLITELDKIYNEVYDLAVKDSAIDDKCMCLESSYKSFRDVLLEYMELCISKNLCLDATCI